MTLRVKFICFFTTVTLVMGLAASAVWYQDTLRMINRYLQDYSRAVMENSYNAFSYMLTDTQYMLNLIATNDTGILKPLEKHSTAPLELIQSRRKIEGVIDELYGYKYYVNAIGVVASDGSVFRVGSAIDTPTLMREIQSHGAAFENGWGTAVFPPLETIYTSDRVRLIPVVRPIESLRGERLGYAMVCLNHPIVESMLTANLPEGGLFQVTDRDGNIIFSNSEIFSPTELEFSLFNLENQYIYSQFYAEQVGWYYSVGIPASGLLGELSQTIWHTAALYAVIYVLALCVVLWFGLRISRRLGALSGAMDLVSSGNLEAAVPPLGSDELGRMGRTFNHMVARIQQLLAQVRLQENQKRETELDFLQAQINPHFLSNTLNTVVWMANMQRAGNISKLTGSLITLLHSTMRRGRDFIALSEELEHIKSYVEIEQCCAFDNFELLLDTPPDTLPLYVPRFILQPIVENALIHAFPELEDRAGEITVSARVEEGKLLLRIRDNGVGMTAEQISTTLQTEKPRDQKAFSSIGIKNVNDRIRLFFGEGYGLSFQSEVGAYTQAVITLPVLGSDIQEVGA